MSLPFLHGWRARLHITSRSHRHLAMISACILATGYGVACLITSVGQDEHGDTDDATLRRYFARGLTKIAASKASQARELADWLHDLCSDLVETALDLNVEPPTAGEFAKSGKVFGMNVESAIRQYAGPLDQQKLFRDFVTAKLDPAKPEGKEARTRIESAAMRIPPAPLANEFLGHLLDDAKKKPEALQAFRREGNFPDASNARDNALDLALELKETGIIRELISNDTYRREASGHQLSKAGSLLGDPWLQARGAIRSLSERARLDVVIVGLMAAMLWYAVFVRFGDRVPWRWVRSVPAVLAGVVSVWPTLMLVHYQDSVMGLNPDGGFPGDLIYFVAGVGLREELCKLALFSLFLPWLLKKRDPLKALLTGALVGLGFALEENMSYYLREGFQVATGRLLTANFFHAAMTAMPALALYEMLRTKFAKAEQFIATFVAVVLAHGIYDWAFTAHQSLPMIGNISLISMVTLALLADQFFHQMELMVKPGGSVISLLSIFVIGSSFVVALSLVLVAVETSSFKSVNAIAAAITSYAPIAIFYIRRIGQY